MSLTIYLEIGHNASLRNKTTQEGFTHDWEVYVKGQNGADIHYYVDKVVFNLHETFPKPKRVVKEAPYLLRTSGYAGFPLPIEIYLKNNQEPKKIWFNYDLYLQSTGPPIHRVQKEKYVFHNPSEDFRSKLLKGGALIGSSGNNHDSNDTTTRLGEEKNQMMSKPKLSGSEVPKKHKYKLDEPRNSDFSNLFGTPILKTTKVVEPPKPKEIPKSSTKPEKPVDKDKPDKNKTKSPYKDKDRDKAKDKSSESIDKKNKDEKRKSKDDRSKERERSREKSSKKDKDRDKSPSIRPKSTSPRRSPKRVSSPAPAKHVPNKDKDKEQTRDEKSERKDKDRKDEKKSKKEKREHKDGSRHKDRDHKDHKTNKEGKNRDQPMPKPKPPSPISTVPVTAPAVHKEKTEKKPKERDPPKEIPKEEDKSDKSRSEKSSEDKQQKHKHKKKERKERRDEKHSKEKKSLERPPSTSKDNKEMTITAAREAADKNNLFGSEPPSPVPPAQPETKPENNVPFRVAEDTSNDGSVKATSSREASPMPSFVAPPKPPTPVVPEAVVKKSDSEKKVRDEPASGPKKREKKERRKDKKNDKVTEKKRKRKSDSTPPVGVGQPPEKQLKEEENNNSDDESKVSSTENVNPLAKNECDMNMLRDLQKKIMGLKDNADLQKVVQLIAETGQYEVSAHTFDFDLCLLNKSTVRQLQNFFSTLS